jgi:hypothetical protein
VCVGGGGRARLSEGSHGHDNGGGRREEEVAVAGWWVGGETTCREEKEGVKNKKIECFGTINTQVFYRRTQLITFLLNFIVTLISLKNIYGRSIAYALLISYERRFDPPLYKFYF